MHLFVRELFGVDLLKSLFIPPVGDKVVLKKPCSGGTVIEYISYVTEVS